MDEHEVRRASRFLSLVLRHRPAAAGIELDAAGWVAVDELLTGLARAGRPLSREQLERLVATNDKQRFAFDGDRRRIRAAQGHSIAVDLGYAAASPPATLLHGTHAAALPAIRRDGLRRMRRHHVHLHTSAELALAVGARRGAAVLLTVRAGAMASDGHLFRTSSNGVWLCDEVPVRYIDFPAD